MSIDFSNCPSEFWSRAMKFFTVETKDPEFKKEMEDKILEVFRSKFKVYLLMAFSMTTIVVANIFNTGGDYSIYSLFFRLCFSVGVTVYSSFLVNKDGQQAVNKIVLLHHLNFQINVFEDSMIGTQFTRLMSMGACVQAQMIIKKCSFYNGK